MPSNTFKASQLITHLRAMIEAHGDMDVALPVKAADRCYAITEKDVTLANWKGAPVFAIAPRDPIADYAMQAEGARGEWNYDLGAAPLGERVRIYKRFGGADEGTRTKEGWSAYEGGARAWPLAPGAVTGWALLREAQQ